jgi:carboxymethylenebutenolidase
VTTQPDGFLAVPPSGTGKGVLVLHAWWGLNDTIKNLCTRLADVGFVAFAPDLFHGKVATTIEAAQAQTQAADTDSVRADITDAISFLQEQSAGEDEGIAVIGFSFGAYFAFEVSVNTPEPIRSVVVFYGAGPTDFSGSQAAYLGHFAETDPYEPREYVDATEEGIRKAGRPVTFHHYPNTGHWFFEPDRTDAYNAEAAELAWQRTLAFLKQHSIQ